MNIEILECDPKATKTHDIFVDGEQIGEIEPSRGHRQWMATLWLSDRRLSGQQLLFGFAATHEEAIAAAIARGHGQIAAITERLAELEAKLGVAAEAGA